MIQLTGPWLKGQIFSMRKNQLINPTIPKYQRHQTWASAAAKTSYAKLKGQDIQEKTEQKTRWDQSSKVTEQVIENT
jgi:hypothetical protein